ncbi:E3 SUMO-protein ligase KIAA1586-like [Saccoglossus kowalevskii]
MKRSSIHSYFSPSEKRPRTADRTEAELIPEVPSTKNLPTTSTTGSVRKFQTTWLKLFSWAKYDQVKQVMTCIYCSAFPDKAGNTDLVTGSSKFKKETLTIHGRSKKHIICRDCFLNKNTTVQQSFERQATTNTDQANADLRIKINTAYCIAKSEMPFTKFRTLLNLQKKNGLDVGTMYANDVKCAEIVATVAEVMKRDIGDKAKESRYISIMCDGATDSSIKENESIIVRYLDDGKPVNKLIGLVELEHAHADGIVAAIDKVFGSVGFEDYRNKLIGFCADGASVNMGETGGVRAKLGQSCEWLITIWCMPHSSKSRRELKALAHELDINVCNPTRVKGTRWSPHTEKALRLLLRGSYDNGREPSGQYHVVLAHAEHLASTSTNTDIKGRSLSQLLQSNKTILPLAVSSLRNTICRIENLTVGVLQGGKLQDLLTLIQLQQLNDAEDIRYQGVVLKNFANIEVDPTDLSSLPCVLVIAMKTAVDMVINGMKRRFSHMLGDVDDVRGAAKAVACFRIFHHDTWPDVDNDLVNYGDDELNYL